MRITPDNWVKKLENNFVLRTICGFDDHLPGIASYYDFINRIVRLKEPPRRKKKKRKPSKKLGKGKKMPPKRPGIVQRLVDKIIAGRRFSQRLEFVLQKIFADVCVQKSIDFGLVPQTISISGDGTCIPTGASNFGVKTCECASKGNYHCDCPRRFSDPNATWGWDLKWRCPKATGKHCDSCVSCSPSAYGRVIYTKPDWDLRLFTTIPRGSERWKLK